MVHCAKLMPYIGALPILIGRLRGPGIDYNAVPNRVILDQQLANMHFIVKLFPEIIVKSPPVRRRQTGLLRDNLVRLLQASAIPAQVGKDWEKIEVVLDHPTPAQAAQCEAILQNTPGIAKFSRARVVGFEQLADIAPQLPLSLLEDFDQRRFAVRAKRSGQQDFSSVDAERELGAWVLQHCPSATVDLRHPERTLELEIRGRRVFVPEQTWPGLGGFPLGSQGGVLALLSGGYDSSVASYQMLRRGLLTHFIFFNLGGAAHELAVRQTAYHLWSRFGRSHRLAFVSVPFQEIVEQIRLGVDGSYANILLKRLMLLAASLVAQRLKLPALITGDSVAQVSSQTLTNLGVTEAAASLPVLRPLIATDKGAIIDLARQIGTADLASSLPEYCGLGSERPTTEAKVQRVAAAESALPPDLLEQCLAQAQFLAVEDLADAGPKPRVRSFEQVPAQALVIDIRHPEEIDRLPLQLDGEVQTIPFFQLQHRASQLSADRLHLLYCERGVLSRLHAELLLEAGLDNIGIYQPRP